MSKKSVAYDNASKFITDKDKSIDTFYRYTLSKALEIFTYSGLPDTIPQIDLERYLLNNGNCIVTRTDDGLYALVGGFSGEMNAYYHPRFYTVSNPYLNLYKEYEIDVDCVLVKNDSEMVGLRPLIMQYGTLTTECQLSLYMSSIIARVNMLISAPDDKTKASAELFIDKIKAGDFSIIAENGFLDGVKYQSALNSNSRYITQFIELMQYYKGSFLNELGLNANFNMKRERISDNEAALNVDGIMPFIDNMLSERKRAVDSINEMFGTDIVVDYNSVWKTNHEQMEQTTALADTELDIVGETVDGNEVIVKDDNVVVDSDSNNTDDNVIDDSDSTTDNNSDTDSDDEVDKDDNADETDNNVNRVDEVDDEDEKRKNKNQ